MSVSAGARVQRRTSGLSDKARKRIEITILSLPALIMFLGFVILPVFMAGYYQKSNIIDSSSGRVLFFLL